MPVLKHAKKKQRQDKKRTAANSLVENSYKSLIKDAKKAKTAASLQKAFQAIDKAAKHFVIHQNKAARLKSSLSKLVSASGTKQAAKAPAKKKAALKKTATSKTSPKTPKTK